MKVRGGPRAPRACCPGLPACPHPPNAGLACTPLSTPQARSSLLLLAAALLVLGCSVGGPLLVSGQGTAAVGVQQLLSASGRGLKAVAGDVTDEGAPEGYEFYYEYEDADEEGTEEGGEAGAGGASRPSSSPSSSASATPSASADSSSPSSSSAGSTSAPRKLVKKQRKKKPDYTNKEVDFAPAAEIKFGDDIDDEGGAGGGAGGVERGAGVGAGKHPCKRTVAEALPACARRQVQEGD